MRRVTTVLLVMAILMVIAIPTAGAVQPERFTFEGETANANWQFEEDDIFVDASVNSGTFTFGGDQFESATFDVFIAMFMDETLTLLFGGTELAPDQFQLDASGGRFSASVEGVDLVLQGERCTFVPSGGEQCDQIGPLEVTVEVTWDEATGRLFPSTFVGRSHSPFGFDAFMSKSLARATTAQGSISGDLLIDLGSSDFAMISRDTDTNRFRFLIS